MQLVCVGEVTPEYDIRVDEDIKSKLHPGEKIKIKIQSLAEKEDRNRLEAIERLKNISMNSRLGLYNETIDREDAHDRESFQDI